MAMKGSAMSRAIRFFREGDLDECVFVLMRGEEIVKEREGAGKTPTPIAPRKRKAKVKANAAESPAQEAGPANQPQ